MDKLILTLDDANAVIDWGNTHEAEILSHPVPLRALEIRLIEIGWSMKGIREGNEVLFHVNQNGQSLGSCKLTMQGGELCKVTKNRVRADLDDLKVLLDLYFAVMAVMAYGWQKTDRNKPDEKHERNPSHKLSRQPRLKQSKSVTYILRRSRKTISIMPEGRHASPQGEFTVRGHFRHYASGKVVWIAEYRKGTGKRKSKIYRLGGGKEKADHQ